MSNIYKYNENEKATVCVSNNCITVYGDTARIINGIIITVVAIIALVFLAKVLR